MAAVGTGVVIGSRTVRVLEVRQSKPGSWQVTKALIAPFADGVKDDARRVAEAKGALKTAQPRGRALVGLSGKDLIVRYTAVPPVPDWRLEMLMNFEIQEVSEQSGGDVSAGYKQLGIDDASSGDNVVLVALAKNAYLGPRLDALKEAGLDALGGCPRAVAAFASYKENGKLSSDETVFLMHIGHENTDVAIARKGVLIFARNVTGGSKLFTEALVQNLRIDAATAEKSKITKGNITPRGKAKYRDSAEEKVANALMGVGGHFVSTYNSSLMFAKAQTKVPDCKPDRVVLMGAGALLKGLPEYVESNLAVPVELFDPFASVDLSALPPETANALKQDQGGSAVALGLAQMAADDKAFRVEVLPASDRKKRRFFQQTLFTVAAAAVLAAAVVAAWTMWSSAKARADDEAKVLADKGKKFSNDLSEFTAAQERVRTANEHKRLMRRLVSLAPALQQAIDLVHKATNETPGPNDAVGFDEIHVIRVAAKFEKVQVPDGAGGQTFVPVPQIEFEAQVETIGSRSPTDAHQQFSLAVKAALDRAGGFRYAFDQLQQQNNRFKFWVQQVQTPEDVAAEAAKAAAESAKPAEGR